ncbi:MAG: response regulator [Pseudomonadota bacterium]
MPETLEDLVMMQPPTAERPLLGSMILVVEDSRHACEAMRLICQRSGARIRRAESLASAERHLRTYRPRIAVIDLGLPDGSGLALIERLASTEPRLEGIIATSGDESLREAAIKAGADTFLAKPLLSVSQFQQVALALLPDQARHIVVATNAVDDVTPDPISLRDDLSLAAELLRVEADQATLDYVAGFLAGIAKCADQPRIAELGDMVRQLSTNAPDQKSAHAIALRIEEEATAFETV